MKKAEKVIVITIISILFLVCLFFVPRVFINNSNKIKSSISDINNDKIHFIKIINASADAIIIESDGHFGLIDTLNPSLNSSVSTREDLIQLKFDTDNGQTLNTYLNSIGCQYLDFVVLTHNHTDHTGGFEDIQSKINNKTIVFYKEDKIAGNDKNEDVEEKKYWFNNDYYLKAKSIMNNKHAITCDVSKSNINPTGYCYLPNIKNDYITEVRKDENPFTEYDTNVDYNYNFNFGNFLVSLYNLYYMSYNIDNYNSIITLVTHSNGTKTLLTGDIETSRGDIDMGNYNKGQTITRDFVENPTGNCEQCTTLGIENQLSDVIGKVDILKAAHHGYASSNSYYMINKLQPDYIIVNNKYAKYETFAAASLYANKRYGTKTYYTGQSDNAVIVKFNNDVSKYNIVNYVCSFNSCYESPTILESSHTFNKESKWYMMNNITNADKKYVYIKNNQLLCSQWLKINDIWYYLDQYGIMVTGLNHIENNYYYFTKSNETTDEKPEGSMYNDRWKKINGDWYYFRSKENDITEGKEGAALIGWGEIKNKYNDIKNWYYFNEEGIMQTGLITDIQNNKYYLRPYSEKTDEYPEGSMFNGGWKKINNEWYYFRISSNDISNGPKGSAIKNQCVTISNEDYCFNNDGILYDEIDLSNLNIDDDIIILDLNTSLGTIYRIIDNDHGIKVFDGDNELPIDAILKTNDTLLVNNNTYSIAVVGDVNADGIINMRDVTKGYKGAMKGNFTSYTDAEKRALDTNNDGFYKLYDVITIYDSIEEE